MNYFCDIKLFSSKIAKMCSVLCDFIEGGCFLLIFLIFSSPCWLRIDLFSLFGLPWKVKRILAFPEMIRFDRGSSIYKDIIKQYQ